MADQVMWHPGLVLPPEQLTPDIIAAIKAALTPQQVLALTAWAEARSQYVKGRGWVSNSISAMLDVQNVVMNRAQDPRWQKLGPKGICLQRWQFSCWEPKGGPDDPTDRDLLSENFERLMERAQWLLAKIKPTDKLLNCLASADAVINGVLTDTLKGACHYYADWLPRPPKWALQDGAEITAHKDGHIFLRGVK